MRWEACVGDCLTRARLRFIAAATIAVGALLLIFSFANTSDNRITTTGLGLGSDYLAFYDAATIVHQGRAHRLYDLNLQSQLYHHYLPGEPANVTLPYANAPFLALMLRPLAMLPYAWSYAIWVMISLAMLFASFALVWQAAGLPARYRFIGLLCALSFEPFLIECLHGGQISAIGLFALSAALYLASTSRPFTAGSVLTLCTYKPTLLPLILPMLLLTRQWRALLGFAIGTILLGFISLLCVGPVACMDYLHLLFGYMSRTSGGTNGAWGFQTFKFIDLNSFLKLLGLPAPVIFILLLIVGIAGARSVIRSIQNATANNRRSVNQSLIWATAITWTLVLNVYVGVYDTVLAIPAVIVTAGALIRRSTDSGRNIPLRFRCLLSVLWALPWISGLIARTTGFQPFTLALLALAVYQLQLLKIRTLPQSSRPQGQERRFTVPALFDSNCEPAQPR